MKSLLFFSLLFLCSCSWDFQEDIPSHYFTNEDYEFLPTVYEKVGKTFTYENQLGEEVTLKVSSYNDIKYYIGAGFGGGESGNYEKLIVRLINKQFPNCFKEIAIYKNLKDNLNLFFSTSTTPIPCEGWIKERVKGPFETSQMVIDEFTYDKVTTLFESNYNAELGYGPFFHPDYTIDKIYYDFKYGIIGFDDTSSNVQFRLVK